MKKTGLEEKIDDILTNLISFPLRTQILRQVKLRIRIPKPKKEDK